MVPEEKPPFSQTLGPDICVIPLYPQYQHDPLRTSKHSFSSLQKLSTSNFIKIGKEHMDKNSFGYLYNKIELN